MRTTLMPWEFREGMLTPWGVADSVHRVEASRIYSVSTPTHGGYMVYCLEAEEYLSKAALRVAERFGNWYAFEEDSAAAVLEYEDLAVVLWAHNFPTKIGRTTYADHEQYIQELVVPSLRRNNAEYWQEVTQ